MTENSEGTDTPQPALSLEQRIRHLSELLGQVSNALDDPQSQDNFLKAMAELNLPELLDQLRNGETLQLSTELQNDLPQIYAALTTVLSRTNARGKLLDKFSSHLQKALDA